MAPLCTQKCRQAVSVAAIMSSAFEALASFSRQARGSIFYNVPLSEIKEGLKFRCGEVSMQGREQHCPHKCS